MPKLKTHSGAKKRFKMTKKGKRLLRKAAYVHGTNLKALRLLMPYK